MFFFLIHIGSKLACIKCWCKGLKLAGQRAFAYVMAEGDTPPPRTRDEMYTYGLKAQISGETVNGIKGLCPFLQLLNLPMQAAIDIAHTLVLNYSLCSLFLLSFFSLSRTLIKHMYTTCVCSYVSCTFILYTTVQPFQNLYIID